MLRSSVQPVTAVRLRARHAVGSAVGLLPGARANVLEVTFAEDVAEDGRFMACTGGWVRLLTFRSFIAHFALTPPLPPLAHISLMFWEQRFEVLRGDLDRLASPKLRATQTCSAIIDCVRCSEQCDHIL